MITVFKMNDSEGCGVVVDKFPLFVVKAYSFFEAADLGLGAKLIPAAFCTSLTRLR